MNTKKLLQWTLIIATIFVILNGIFALTIGYLVAAGADGVYHGVQLGNLGGMCGAVFLLGLFCVAMCWFGYGAWLNTSQA